VFGEQTYAAILKPLSKAQNSLRRKIIDTGEDMGQFSAGHINKSVPSFRNNSTENVNSF